MNLEGFPLGPTEISVQTLSTMTHKVTDAKIQKEASNEAKNKQVRDYMTDLVNESINKENVKYNFQQSLGTRVLHNIGPSTKIK